MGRRRAAIALVALALLATACGGGSEQTSEGVVDDGYRQFPRGPQTYTVSAGAPSPEGQNREYAFFSPVSLRVRPGDTVVFENRSTQSPHTVTFGAAGIGDSKVPSPLTTAARPNPAVFEPCYLTDLLPNDAEACPAPAPATPPAYQGAGYWNSGALAPAGAEGPHQVSFTVAPETPVDTYSYRCLLHRSMHGSITVVEGDEERKTPADMAKRAGREHRALTAAAEKLTEPAPAEGVTVTAGWGDSVTAINRFSPAVATVKAGQKVTWKTAIPVGGHTVTFASPFQSPREPAAFAPGGAPTGSRYTGGFAHSGLIGPEPFPTDTFELVFPEPGTYRYVCVLHPGMGGEVVVTN